MRTFIVGTIGLSVLLAAGCKSSSHFPEDSADAERAIDRAEDAGASRHSRDLVRQARETLDVAHRSEEAAIEDRKQAREQLRAAQERNVRATQRVELRRSALESERDRKKVCELELDRLRERVEDLRAKGVKDEDVKNLVDTNAALANARLRSTEAAIAALEKEVELLQLEQKDAELAIQASQARLDTAEQRLQVSRALLARAHDQARLAEAEALEAKRLETRARLTQM